MRTGSAAGLWHVQDCEEKAKFLCKQQAEAMTFHPPVPEKNSYSKCPMGWDSNNNISSCFKCYKVFGSRDEDRVMWIPARRTCVKFGGNLASIPNEQVQAFLTYHLKDAKTDAWIGLNDINSELHFVWADGSGVYYTNWIAGSPVVGEIILYDSLQPETGNNLHQLDCVVVKTGPVDKIGQWKDEPCYEARGFICQMDSVMAPTDSPQLFGRCPESEEHRSWVHYRSHCYYIESSYTRNWAQASRECTRLGQWLWRDNTAVDFVNWNEGEPSSYDNEKCVEMYASSGYWNDAQCSYKRGYICKKSEREEKDEEVSESSTKVTWLVIILVILILAGSGCVAYFYVKKKNQDHFLPIVTRMSDTKESVDNQEQDEHAVA
ncbi:Macrophage mannose receptor 1 [Chelonia mydas]|uniref:Macrophage mannose receptor 1 n=1 Tax=Chelonia mydas TaxID=8469 RepID=M7C8S5_CHEMY|nr:Macrophage mannose receptor 1 [Chelonia mydas]